MEFSKMFVVCVEVDSNDRKTMVLSSRVGSVANLPSFFFFLLYFIFKDCFCSNHK